MILLVYFRLTINPIILLPYYHCRLKESGAINKSLFSLGEVVDAINSGLVSQRL